MDEGTVRAVLAAHGRAAGVVRPLGGGLDHATVLVDDELVVRLVRERAERGRVVPEARLLAAVAGAVPLPVPEPLVVDAARGCLAYRRLPGRPALGLPGLPDHAAALGKTLGRFLAALHRLPTDLAEPDDAPRGEWLAEARALYPGVRAHVPARHRAAVEAFLSAPPPPEGGTPVLTHHDLGAEHVLVDEAWQVTGVIDWGDAAVTDPARDLGLILRDLGPRGLDAALAAYGPGLDAGCLERAVLHARCAALEDLAHGLSHGLPDYTANALAALDRLFADDAVPQPAGVPRPPWSPPTLQKEEPMSTSPNQILVLGGTGTTGSRVVAGLEAAGVPARPAGRRTDPPFDWTDPGTWDAVLEGVERMYLLLPDDVDLPAGFLERAAATGVRRVVLHSDRAADLMGVTRLQDAERAVRASGLEWTILRPDWFAQNFETFFRDAVLAGDLRVPVGHARQGFVDVADIADVAVRALTTDDHVGEVLELTGPQALSFAEAAEVVGGAAGRTVRFDGTPEAYRTAMGAAGLPPEAVDELVGRFAALAAAGDTTPTATVERVLGRPARSFDRYASEAAARGVWA